MPQLIRIVVIGDAESGKTQLIRRLMNKGFEEKYKCTIGVDFDSKEIEGKILQLWDTAGQERFQGLGVAFYKETDLFIYCIDSFKEINQQKVIEDIKQARSYSPDARILIVATKSDRLEKPLSTIYASSKIKLDEEEFDLVLTTASNNNLVLLESFLNSFARAFQPKKKGTHNTLGSLNNDRSANYSTALDELTRAFEVLAQPVKTDLRNKLASLNDKLADANSIADNKVRLLIEFTAECEAAFKNHPSTLTRVLEIIAIIALPILVGVIGFGVGFALGLWTGPGAFLSGLAAGQAAAVAVTAVTGASTLVSGGLAYGLFRPAAAPTEIKKFDEVARAEFYLPAAVPAA